ncbi:hypothetical protein ILYODFUR_039083, partial [Ilyodon furcidens]
FIFGKKNNAVGNGIGRASRYTWHCTTRVYIQTDYEIGDSPRKNTSPHRFFGICMSSGAVPLGSTF